MSIRRVWNAVRVVVGSDGNEAEWRKERNEDNAFASIDSTVADGLRSCLPPCCALLATATSCCNQHESICARQRQKTLFVSQHSYVGVGWKCRSLIVNL